jgi:2-phospho-L-lactate/phosphoenolpyruvate guanylyltransferase
MGDSVWAVVVARSGSAAKSRLASVLNPAQRQRLALAMLADVIAVCMDAGLAGVLAVVDAPAARSVVERSGAIALADPGTGDMNAAVTHGLEAAAQFGASTAIVVPGDVPLISVADFESLLGAAGATQRAVVIGASHDRQGTNALLLRPPDVIAPGFGPPSVQRHLEAGLAASALTQVRSDLGLALDVDLPDDLAALHPDDVGRHTATALVELAAAPALRRL